MRYLILLMILSACVCANAQGRLEGKVMDSESDVALDGATIFNTTKGLFRKAGQNGLFSIRADEGDVLIFSSTGYRPDTLEISADILTTGLYLGLKAMPVTLDTVTVTQRTYAEDSLARRLEYSHLLDRPVKDATGGNTPQYGAGIVISPSAIFSKSERQKRKFRRQFKEYEKNAYIDYYFSPSYVHRVTGMEGEELRKFMRENRPSYSFMRRATPEDLLLHVNDALIKWKRKK